MGCVVVEDHCAVYGHARAFASFPTSSLHQRSPTAAARTCVRYLYGLWDRVTLTVAIGLFWYWVAMNIVSWRERRVAYLFSRRPLRILADSVIIGIGVLWIVVCFKEISHYPDERIFSAPNALWYAPAVGIADSVGDSSGFVFWLRLHHSLVRRTPA